MAVDLLLAVCMLVQEVANMLVHLSLINIYKEYLVDVEKGAVLIQSGITCLPLPEQKCLQLVTGPWPCKTFAKHIFLSPMQAGLQIPAMKPGD